MGMKKDAKTKVLHASAAGVMSRDRVVIADLQVLLRAHRADMDELLGILEAMPGGATQELKDWALAHGSGMIWALMGMMDSMNAGHQVTLDTIIQPVEEDLVTRSDTARRNAKPGVPRSKITHDDLLLHRAAWRQKYKDPANDKGWIKAACADLGIDRKTLNKKMGE